MLTIVLMASHLLIWSVLAHQSETACRIHEIIMKAILSDPFFTVGAIIKASLNDGNAFGEALIVLPRNKGGRTVVFDVWCSTTISVISATDYHRHGALSLITIPCAIQLQSRFKEFPGHFLPGRCFLIFLIK